MPESDDITRILAEIGESPHAAERLIEVVRDDLRRRAALQLRASSGPSTLDPTALVHEVYVRLFGRVETPTWEDRSHFFFAASRAMHDILVERARRATRIKRGGDRSRVPLEPHHATAKEARLFLELHEVLTRLEQVSARRAAIVRLRFYCGISLEEIAESMGISRSTVWREWAVTKVWLIEKLGADSGDLVLRTRI